MNGVTASRRNKMKSISVEDLATIVKQMISGALEDTEQMAKLHRAIYEELYFERLTDLEGGIIDEKSNDRPSRIMSKAKSIRDITVCNELDKCAKTSSKINCNEETRENLVSGNLADGEKTVLKTVNESAKTLIDKSSKESKINTQKCKRVIDVEVKIKPSEILLDESVKMPEQAFDVWRKEKIEATRRVMKEKRMKKEEELAAKQQEIEKKIANHEAYLRSKRVLETQRKLDDTQRRTIVDDRSIIQEEENRRIMANEEAFRAWIKRKNSEQRCSPPRKFRPQTGLTRYCGESKFDCWLDQLDSVLHQKYLRERRHRVRSFYCQPAYYGNAALAMQ